jgi:outer membrane protein, heavy metal efflux system
MNVRWTIALLAALLCAGCVSPGQKTHSVAPASATPISPSSPPIKADTAAADDRRPITPVSYLESKTASDALPELTELSLAQLTAEVQACNPSAQAMMAAWQAAAQRYPQMVSLDDPMFGFMLGPTGLGHDGGWMVMASQKVPWCGKRALRGVVAEAEAEMAGRDLEDVRLRLAEATAMTLSDYYQARRELEINVANVDLMTQFREIAKTRYESNQVSQQDVLQSDVELAELESRRAEVMREEKIAVARINTLLHRPADSPLPPPPRQLDVLGDLPPVDSLQLLAVQKRPDLAARQARIQADEANLELADKEFYPDLEVVAKYDAFMPEDMRSQVGLNLNVPIRHSRRCAALSEAAAKLQQRRAELQAQIDEVHLQVQTAFEMFAEQQTIIRLYAERTLPAAEENTRSAQANYTAGKIDFLRLIEAQRQLYRQQERYQQALADRQRRAAELERAIGGPLSLMQLPRPGGEG